MVSTRRITFMLLAMLSVLLGTGAAFATDPDDARIKVFGPDTGTLRTTLERQGYDVLGHNAALGFVELIATPAEVRTLEAAGHRTELIETFGARASRGVPAGYHDFDEIETLLFAAQTQYPQIMRIIDAGQEYQIGNTHEGRPLYIVKISDNVMQDEDEPGVLFMLDRHAREITTAEFAIWMIDELTQGYGTDPDVTKWVDQNEIYIGACWNPDGLQYCHDWDEWWRKNRSPQSGGNYGVDLNRNYDFHWDGPYGGSTNPGSITFRGPYVESERETRVEVAFANDHALAKMLDVHSYGSEMLYTYPNSSQYPSTLESYMKALAQEISYAFNYGGSHRKASAEGESYEWNLCYRCTCSWLVETGTSFQPSFTTAKNEFASHIWPGFSYLLDLEIPLKGHVVEAGTGTPLEADIAIQGINYTQGEVRRSDPKFGRYYYFLPAGTYQVTFSAPGYTPRTETVNIVKGKSLNLEVQLGTGPALTVKGELGLNTTSTLDFDWPAGPGHLFYNGVSLLNAGFTFKNGIHVPVGWDLLYQSTLGVVPGWTGTLDGAGHASATLPLPNEPTLIGMVMYMAYFTVDPATYRASAASAAVRLEIF